MWPSWIRNLAIILITFFSLQVSVLPGHAAHHAIHDAYGDHQVLSICDLCHAYDLQNTLESLSVFILLKKYSFDSVVAFILTSLLSRLSLVARARGPPQYFS
jgi:hypothetical protein